MRTEKRERDTLVEKVWEHKELTCCVLLIRQSHRCGYVRVPKNNPAFELNYEDVPVDVHGGLTFSNMSLTGQPDDENYHWFGFDCAHFGDEIRLSGLRNGFLHGHWWTLEEVITETNSLAEQLADLTWKEIVLHKMKYLPVWFTSRVELKKKSEAK